MRLYASFLSFDIGRLHQVRLRAIVFLIFLLILGGMCALCGLFSLYLHLSHFLFLLQHLRVHGFPLPGILNASLGYINLLIKISIAKDVEGEGDY